MNTQTFATLRMIAQRADAAARADWAPYVERGVRAVVAVAVAVYVVGAMVGAAVHAANDWLAPRFARVVLACDVCGAAAQGDDPKPAAPAALAPVAAAPLSHPLETMRDELLALTARELRTMAGVASKRYTKAAMADMILAMA